MRDNYLKPYADKRPKKKTELEPVTEEVKKALPVKKKQKASKKSQPSSPYKESEKSNKSTSSSDTLLSSEESKRWRTPPSKKDKYGQKLS